MKNYEECEVCKEWHWTDDQCDPEYFVFHPDYMGDEPKIVRAVDYEDAGKKYGKWYNQDDYDLINETIKIKVEKDGKIKFFEIGAELDIHYSSIEIDEFDYNQ